MPRGGRLAIGARRVGGGVELTVSDSGAGIDAESQKRIFEPFFSTKESGTGLGLALTKQIIEEHGGEISCDSELGKGTRFAIRFPLPERGKEVTEWYGS